MIMQLDFKQADKELPEVGRKVLCLTKNKNYFVSEMYLPHDGRGNVYDLRA